MHGKALGMLTRKLTDIFKSTPIGKAMAGATPEERSRVSKLMEIAYFIASEEILFLKFPGLVELKNAMVFCSLQHTRLAKSVIAVISRRLPLTQCGNQSSMV